MDIKSSKKIAVIGANEPSLPFYKQAKALGYEIHSFAWAEGAVCKEYADCFYPISFTEKEQILDICKQVGIEAVTSFSLESAIPTVNYIARGLSLPCNSLECETLMENKYTMRERLKECGVGIPQYIITNRSDIDANLPFPLIVKPIDSGGSRGITKVENKQELNEAIERALPFSKKGKVLVEQFIDGDEFSVEYLTFQGKHYFVAITDKVTTGEPYFVELEHHQPSRMSVEIQDKIKAITEATLTALQVEHSITHTELKLDSKGNLYIIETGARMGGDYITSDLVRLSTGYDFVHATIELASGNLLEPTNIVPKYSGIYFLSENTKYVKSYILQKGDYKEIIEAEITNDELIEVKENADRVGYLIYQSNKKFEI